MSCVLSQLQTNNALCDWFCSDRANLRFADVDGWGRADIIQLDKYTGAGTASSNNVPSR
jgi:hypothetical protein